MLKLAIRLEGALACISRRFLLSAFAMLAGSAILRVPSIADEAFGEAHIRAMHQRLQGEVGKNVWSLWFAPMEVESLRGGVLTVSVPTEVGMDAVSQLYSAELLRAARRANPSIERVVVMRRLPKELPFLPSQEPAGPAIYRTE